MLTRSVMKTPVANSSGSATNGVHVRQRAPPALARVEDVERDDERQRRRIEHVGRARAEDVLADDGDRGRAGGDVPGLVRAQDHRDEQPGEDRAARETPSAFRFRRRIGTSISAATATALARPGATRAMPSRRRRDGGEQREDDREQAFRRSEELVGPAAGKTLRRIALQRRGHDQPIHAVTLEQRDAVGGAEHERRRRQRVGRPSRSARRRSRSRPRSAGRRVRGSRM